MQPIRVSVSRLFDLFDHDIRIHPEAPVTIVHGPNGYGKTALLRMISAIAAGTLEVFRSIPFDTFCIAFDNGQRIEVRHGKPDAERSGVLVELVSPSGDRTRLSHGLSAKEFQALPSAVLDAIDENVPRPYGRFNRGWRNENTGEPFSLADIADLFPAITELPPLN